MKYGTLCYIYHDNKVLIVKKLERENDPNSGFYVLPGGKLEESEKGFSLNGRLESITREFSDETGLTIRNPRLRGVILFDNFERTFDNWKNSQDFFVYVFSAEEFSGELRSSDEGEPLWINEQDIENLPRNQGDVKIYEWLKDGRYFAGVIKHKGKELDSEGTFVDYI